ncbi:MAG: hypothetical protein EOP48_21920 [Sphingobacteriales bacterium]|nr:MAG: hypothetical protein EOP48_21920 [Sphingobacteriales bacterium]
MIKILSLFLLTIWAGYSQDNKGQYFFDENWKPVTFEQFESKIDHRVNIAVYTQNDTAVIAKITIRTERGILEQSVLEKIQHNLEAISGRQIDKNKIIIINYYPGLDNYYPAGISKWGIYDKDYIKKVNKIAEVEQFWIYKHDKNLRYHHGKRLNWLHDKDAMIEKTFFPNHYNYGSFAIIDTDGSYYLFFGEYGKTQVWEELENIVQKKNLTNESKHNKGYN